MLRELTIVILFFLVSVAQAAEPLSENRFELLKNRCLYKAAGEDPSKFDILLYADQEWKEIYTYFVYPDESDNFEDGMKYQYKCSSLGAEACDAGYVWGKDGARSFLTVRPDGKIYAWHVFAKVNPPYTVEQLYELRRCL